MALAILGLAGPLSAQTAANSSAGVPPTLGVTATRIARLEVPLHPAVAPSPDGRFYAALQTRPDPMLWIVPTGEGAPFAFRRMWAAYAPRWAPSGDRVGFIAAVGPPRVWTVELDPETGRPIDPPRMLIHTAANAYAFAPDGRRIALVTSRSTAAGASRIVIVDWRTRQARALPRERGLIYRLDWSPDDGFIYYGLAPDAMGPDAYHEVRRISLRGGAPESLARTDEFLGLAPDGDYLLCRPAGREEETGGRLELVGTDGAIAATLDLPDRAGTVRWGADSHSLVQVRRRQGAYELIRLELDRSGSQP